MVGIFRHIADRRGRVGAYGESFVGYLFDPKHGPSLELLVFRSSALSNDIYKVGDLVPTFRLADAVHG